MSQTNEVKEKKSVKNELGFSVKDFYDMHMKLTQYLCKYSTDEGMHPTIANAILGAATAVENAANSFWRDARLLKG